MDNYAKAVVIGLKLALYLTDWLLSVQPDVCLCYCLVISHGEIYGGRDFQMEAILYR